MKPNQGLDEALRESEAFYHDLYDNAPDMFVSVDMATARIVECNATLTRVTGYAKEEIIGRKIFEMYDPAYVPRAKELYVKLKATGELHDEELRLRCKDGRLLDVSLNTSAVRDASGRVIRSRTVWRDITGRKRAEALLAGQKRVLEMAACGASLQDTLTALVLLIESQAPGMLGSILLLDKDGAHIRHGAAPSLPVEYVTAINGQLIGPCAGSCGTAAYRKAAVFVEDIATDPLWVAYREAALPHGLRACWSTPILDMDGRVLGTFAMYYRQPGLPRPEHRQLIDLATHMAAVIIGRHQREMALRESEARLRNLFEQASDGIFLISTDNRYLDANARGLEMLGYTREELLQMNVADVLAPRERPRLAVEPAEMMAGKLHLAEWEHLRKDGSTFPAEVSARRLDDQSYLAIVRDLTARRQAEAMLRENAERLRLAVQAANIGLWDWDLQTNRVVYSREWKSQLGYEEHEIGDDFSEWESRVHPDDLAPTLERIRRYIARPEGAHEAEFRMRHKDGGWRWIYTHAEVICDADGRPARMLGCHVDITERKRMEEERQKFFLLAESSSEFIGMCDLDLKPLYVNPAGVRMVGLPDMDAACRVKVPDYFFPEDRHFIVEEFFPRVQREGHGEVEIRLRHFQTGEPIWMSYYLFHVRDAGGRVIGWATVSRDITERKRVEEALAESETRLRTILESEPECVKLLAADGTLLEMNPAGLAMIEADSAAQVQGKKIYGLIQPEYHAAFGKLVARSFGGETGTLEFEITGLKGTHRWLETHAAPLRGRQGKIVASIGLTRDITARKEAEMALAETERRYRQLVNSSPSVIYATTFTLPHRCTFISETLLRLTGHEPGAMKNDPGFWPAHVHPDDREQVEALIEHQLASGKGELEYRFRFHDGRYHWIRDTFRVAYDAEGRPQEIIGSWTDVSESRRMEEQLAQSQKMEAVGQLTGGVAHDFNNRLTVILGNLELLQRRLGNDPAAARLLMSALSAADGAADLTRQLLTFSRKQVLEPVRIDMNELTAAMHDMLQRTLGEAIAVKVSPEPGLWPIRADRNLLENALLNLAVNARDAMPGGGTLTIESHNIVLSEDYVMDHPYASAGEYVQLTVSDTGMGMSEEIKRRIFEPFFTTKPAGKGTGLGLAMVYGFIKQSGGTIEVYSEPGCGTSFKIYLPRAVNGEHKKAAQESGSGDKDKTIGGRTVLLVEDDEALRKLAVLLLEETGCKVLTAGNGPAALKVLDSHPAIDLLFTDMIMPGGMTGVELAAKIRERLPELKVLYTSGYAPQAAADRRSISHLNDHWLAKPYRAQSFNP